MPRYPGVFSAIVRYTKRGRLDRRTTRGSPARDRRVTMYTYELACGHKVTREGWCLRTVRCPVCTKKSTR